MLRRHRLRQRDSRQRESRQSGFTLLELLVVMSILIVVSSIGLPALQQTLKRSKIDANVQQVVQLMYTARSEAVRRNAQVAVVIDWTPYDDAGTMTPMLAITIERLLETTIAGGTEDAFDSELGRALVGNPASSAGSTQVHLWGAADNDPWDCDIVSGFSEPSWRAGAWSCTTADTPNIAVFNPDGSIQDEGGFRIGFGPFPRFGEVAATDQGRNFMEVLVSPQATAKVKVRKWVPQIQPTDLPPGYYLRERINNKMNWEWY